MPQGAGLQDWIQDALALSIRLEDTYGALPQAADGSVAITAPDLKQAGKSYRIDLAGDSCG